MRYIYVSVGIAVSELHEDIIKQTKIEHVYVYVYTST